MLPAAKAYAEEHKNEEVKAPKSGNPEKAGGSKVVEGAKENNEELEA